MQELDQKLNALFRAYRDAMPDPEPGAAFTPGVWARIDARRREQVGIRHFARRFVALAGAMSLASALLVLLPARHTDAPLSTTYVEALAEDHAEFVLAAAEIPDQK